MRIGSVTIEGLRGTRRGTYHFDQATYFHGPNGSGKSTVLNAVQLALLGYIPGTAKKPADIMAHANGPEIRVSVDLVQDDGNVITVTRSVRRKGTGATMSVSVSPDVDIDKVLGDSKLPIFDWSEFTSMTSNKLKDWFIGFVPGMNDEVDWKSELDDSVDYNLTYNKSMVQEYADKLSAISAESAVDQVAQANKLLKSDRSYVKGVLDEKESTLAGLVHFDVSDVSDKESAERAVAKAQSKLNEALETRDKANGTLQELVQRKAKYDSEVSKYDSVTKSVPSEKEAYDKECQLRSVRDTVDKLSAEWDKLESERVELSHKGSDLSDKIGKIESRVTELSRVTSSDGTCPYTSSSCRTITDLKDKYLKELESLKTDRSKLINERNEVYTSIKLVEAQQDERDAKITSGNELQRSLESWLQSYRDKVELVTSLSVPNPDDNVSDSRIAQAQEQLSEANDVVDTCTAELQKAKNVMSNASMIESLTKDKYTFQERYDVLNSWVKLTDSNGLQSTLSSGGFEALEANLSKEVERVFGAGTKCKFNVTNKANSFSFGIVRNDIYIPYNLLSTGEKTLFAFALMLYVAQNSGSDLKVVMMDDFFDHLDSDRFASLMHTVQSNLGDVQIVMAGVVPCDSDFVSVVEL